MGAQFIQREIWNQVDKLTPNPITITGSVPVIIERIEHQGIMATDYTPYVIIDDVTMSKVMERLNQGKAMAEKSYPHLAADFERVIKKVRERAECFTGSQNKPKTTKAYGR